LRFHFGAPLPENLLRFDVAAGLFYDNRYHGGFCNRLSRNCCSDSIISYSIISDSIN